MATINAVTAAMLLDDHVDLVPGAAMYPAAQAKAAAAHAVHGGKVLLEFGA